MLVKLSIGMWSASKTDKEVSSEVIANKKAMKSAGVFRKHLVSKNALKEIQKIATAARQSHYVLTLPWNDDGARIIPTESYDHYAKTMRDYRRSMEEAVDAFLENYHDYIKNAKDELGDMFNPDDYPDPDDIRSKFFFDVEPTQIPASKDFRAKVSDKEVAAITKDIERRTKARLDSAMKDVWRRIADNTAKMVDRLENYVPAGVKITGPEYVFRDSLVENIRDLADTLPALNIKDDPNLTKIHESIVKNLCKYDAEDLRIDDAVRRKTAKRAKAIHDKVSKYLA